MRGVVLFRSVQGRVARPADFRCNYSKTLMQTAIMWAIFYFALPALIYKLEGAYAPKRYCFRSRYNQLAGILLFITGGVLAEISAITMVAKGQGTPLPADAPRKLVVAGPYRYVRNPMAVGSFAQGIAVGLYVGSPMIVAYALAGTLGWNYSVRPWEELDLERRFGEPYARYRDAVRCWIPNLRPYEG